MCIVADKSERGYCFGDAAVEAKDAFNAVRSHSPINVRVIRFLLHASLVLGRLAGGGAWESTIHGMWRCARVCVYVSLYIKCKGLTVSECVVLFAVASLCPLAASFLFFFPTWRALFLFLFVLNCTHTCIYPNNPIYIYTCICGSQRNVQQGLLGPCGRRCLHGGARAGRLEGAKEDREEER